MSILGLKITFKHYIVGIAIGAIVAMSLWIWVIRDLIVGPVICAALDPTNHPLLDGIGGMITRLFMGC